MRDPHVQSLYYAISSRESISYKDPDPIHFINNIGEFNLAKGRLKVNPSDHFPYEAAARAVVEPFLKLWEMGADLTYDLAMIKFKFERSEIIDRDPTKLGETINATAPGRMGWGGVKATIQTLPSTYPNPPAAFTTTPTVELVYRRWLHFKDGKESLQSASYFVLTVIEEIAGGRKPAAITFNIEEGVLRKIGELSSTRGDADTARKVEAAVADLTSAEKHWLEAATRKVIYRMGQHASGGPLNSLTFADLPEI